MELVIDLALITSMLSVGRQIRFFEAVFPNVKCLSYKLAVRIR